MKFCFATNSRISQITIALTILCIPGCQIQQPSPKYVNEIVLQYYQITLSSLDPESPGLGFDPGRTSEKLDHAMSYALFASAEAKRYQLTKETEALDSAIKAAKWLMQNTNQTTSGEIGWGLPFAWDAFADGSVNDVNTIYTITTALGILGLLDVYDSIQQTSLVNEQLAPQLLKTASLAATTFANGKFDDLGSELVFWYSDQEQDSYHVFNVTSMMLGAFQRLSTYIPEPEKSLYRQLADRAFQYVLARFQIDGQRRMYWNYSGDKVSGMNRPNDSVHEVYVFHGLINYKVYGGSFGTRINLENLYQSLRRFIDEGAIREWAKGEGPDDRPARLWGAGYLLFITSLIEQKIEVKLPISNLYYCLIREQYYDKEKQLWYFRPDLDDLRVYPRHTTHLMIGLIEATKHKINCD